MHSPITTMGHHRNAIAFSQQCAPLVISALKNVT
jgi:hypothetical protein